ncbi:MAG TPA: sigma-54 dependent transcriptional regulator [Thermodesulfobacteriota bacterium]
MRKILIATDDGERLAALEAHLGRYLAVASASVDGAVEACASERPEAVIMDLDSSGEAVLDRLLSTDPGASIICLTSRHGLESTVDVIRKGAFDCLYEPVDMKALDDCLKRVFDGLDLTRSLADIRMDAYRPDTLVGRSRAMEEIFKTIGIASLSKVTILIQGESGTGKELIARAIHSSSEEMARPFVAINCSALVETLLESELFGHEKGAFTGALFKKEGKFEAAAGGTVFLDEIGEMSQALQVKLLRVLQERSFERVGGSETIRTDVRVIAATNRELFTLTSRGAFREDLFYRLKVITIDVPPLRERKEDIPHLVAYLLEKANRELHKRVTKVPDEVMERLIDYDWPGNVRELENVITRGVFLAKGGVLLDIKTLERANDTAAWSPESLIAVEARHIAATLDHAGWNRSKAARLLGVSIPRLERKILRYGLKP